MKLFRRGGAGDSPDQAYLGLRSQALGLTRDQLGAAPETAVLAVLMETGYESAVVTLLSVIDGTTSLYFSNGGGLLGAGETQSVSDATLRFVSACEREVSRLLPRPEPPGLPSVGETQFVAVTGSGLMSASAAQDELGRGDHPLARLFYAGQDVITQVRVTQERTA